MLAWAQEQSGKTPYVFGGRHVPPQLGWDCAGFVMEAFAQIAVDIDPDHGIDFTNAQRLLDHCDIVPYDERQAGDLIFFERTYPTVGASHVGIVISLGVMIDDHQRNAESGPGETNYDTAYWKSRYLAVGRVRR